MLLPAGAGNKAGKARESHESRHTSLCVGWVTRLNLVGEDSVTAHVKTFPEEQRSIESGLA